MLSADFPVSDSYIALASFVATIPCYAASNRVGAERASRRCECWRTYYAWRKRQRYGTMLMDLERLHVLDLLPVRSAESFAHWLGLHPEVEVITRDRSSLYADGGRQGAPSAVQITDLTICFLIWVRRWSATYSSCRSTREES